MSTEMVDRHKGIKTESAFSLAMFRWVNKIIEFVKVSNALEQIGIKEVEVKIEKLKNLRDSQTQLLSAKTKQGQPRIFKRLKANQAVIQTLDKISDTISSLEGSDNISEYSLDFCTDSDL